MLTPRETEILQLKAMGQRNTEIAATLGISAQTVKVHVGHILKDMGCRNACHAVYKATGLGILVLMGQHE